MRDNFEACLRHVLQFEGGFVDHPRDPGGATNKGVTIATYRAWKPGATVADLKRITDAEVAAIYKAWYWQPVRGDNLPPGLDLVAFDAAVNSGPSRGAKWLQQALGVQADGQIGQVSLAAAGRQYGPAVIQRACAIRLGFLRSLGTWDAFGRGWQRRVEATEALALQMAEPDGKTSRKPPKNLPTNAAPATGLFAALMAVLKSIFGGKK